MKCIVKCYYQTGFDSTNIPDSPELLETVPIYKTFDSIYVKQNRSLTSIKLATTYNNIKDVDYISLNFDDEIIYYIVLDIQMLNDNVANLTILEDTLTTVGGAININYLDGWCTRRCVNDDTLFSNCIPEDFSPKFPMELSNFKFVGDKDYNYDISYNIVLSTVDLSSPEISTATIYTGLASENDYSVSVPDLPPLTKETLISIKCKGANGNDIVLSTRYPNIGMFDYNNDTVQKSIAKLRALGLESVIVGCYKIPSFFVDSYSFSVEGSPGYYVTFNVKYIEDEMKDLETNEILSFLYNLDYTPKNNKIFSQFNSVTIFSASSGDSKTYEMNELYNGGAIPSFVVTPEASNEGCPYCRPSYFKGSSANEKNFFLNGIKSTRWINTPLVMSGASGALIDQANSAIIKDQAGSDWELNVLKNHGIAAGMGRATQILDPLSSTLSSASNIASGDIRAVLGLLSGDYGAALGVHNGGDSLGLLSSSFKTAAAIGTYDWHAEGRALADMARTQQQQKQAFEVSQNIVVPSVNFGQVPTIQMYLGIAIYAYVLRLSDKDLRRFDTYLTRYGYKTSEPITKECFKGRKNFNYVEAQGIALDKSINFRRKNDIGKILNNGVRVWHKLPDITLMDNNPITT